MKAFLASIAAIVVISAAAGLVLQSIDRSASTVYTSPSGSVRL
ncbi:MAG TPA: hypothetical protein VK943_10110 [Arenibaculum sp.]|nr:hypothetical protein [Arenibaculum sp.]